MSETQDLNLKAVTACQFRRVLDLTGGKTHGPGGALELLGINPNILRYRMRKLRMRFGKRRGD